MSINVPENINCQNALQEDLRNEILDQYTK